MHHQNRLTNEAENVTNVLHEDDKEVDSKKQAHGDGDVNHPVKGLIREQKLKDSTAYLRRYTKKLFYSLTCIRKLVRM